ncbi:MAG TPA: CoA activase [Caldithrix abyssi]|uniref:CoA activase n=1 Tax=Caldithrix abyssi TaxID=187145 RepID=A0A7V4U0N4_CALAY|nr:CoA activase [Caldithrix abyssi]
MRGDSEKGFYLGIDIGSVSVSFVLIDHNGEVVKTGYDIHHGNILKTLRSWFDPADSVPLKGLAYNQRAAVIFKRGLTVNDQVAAIEGLKYKQAHVRSLFTIGGETFGLILFDKQGRYQKYIANSSCAAGTGSFLDQQAERLGLGGSAELSDLAASFKGERPKIATRCAVFAKTDLIHSQQQGYSVAAISDGLCEGLAQNIADTLVKGVELQPPVFAIGGVSKNRRVMHHLSEIIGHPIHIPPESETVAALGCALIARNTPAAHLHQPVNDLDDLLVDEERQKQYFFPELELKYSQYPDFDSHTHYLSGNVEVDVYHLQETEETIPAYLGIDIGSTSTKAVVMDTRKEDNNVLLGLYTRTKGQPVKAVQELLKVLDEIEEQRHIRFEFKGVGTTGSGRKFIQKVISADLAVDEITAHARAAAALNPDTDTIIEIGGQDAKFTVLKNGQVTFSVMNYVCAAGTGSFIEEQAKRLNVPLQEFARRASGVPSPLTSDRCTVFMERDLNHLMQQGYEKEELLAAALHSVRDNYLSKVAHLNKIGNVICFQGATAKNKALVAAFEQKLQKPIFVSRYCHLTGALGVCLMLKEEQVRQTVFRGIEFHQESLEVRDDMCDLCNNHCKLKVIELADDKVVWGYLCGREETDHKPRRMNRSGFDLLSSRRRIFMPNRRTADQNIPTEERKSFFDNLLDFDLDRSLEKLKRIDFRPSMDNLPSIHLDESLSKVRENVELNLLSLRRRVFAPQTGQEGNDKHNGRIRIGIPNTLNLLEFVPFWQDFFERLGYQVALSRSSDEGLTRGKEISGAEFCMPISNWHGHVMSLTERCDYLFLPHILEEARKDEQLSMFCYYTNYASSMVQNIEELNLKGRSIAPLIDLGKPAIFNIRQIYDSLPQPLKIRHDPREIQSAFHESWDEFLRRKQKLIDIFREQVTDDDDISVVFVGRPYLALDRVINKNIPSTFNKMGIKTFFQDMLPPLEEESSPAGREFLGWNHWRFGNQILEAAEYIGRKRNVYAVYLTAFKCAPDSFILTYFKEIMEAYHKPYLILQLDEHGSDVGYETRIEAAVRSFRNHAARKETATPEMYHSVIDREPGKEGTILIPNYDALAGQLICAAFEHAGYKPVLIDEQPDTVISSLRINDGQCLPISTIVQGAVETVQKKGLEPEKTYLFLNTLTNLSCNFPQYPVIAQKMLEQTKTGKGIRVFATEFDMRRMPYELIYDVYSAYLLGGFLRKMACKIRPYELTPGLTDRVIEQARQTFYQAIAGGQSRDELFDEVVRQLEEIPVSEDFGKRPKVSIIGDLYVRDNDVFNQNLIRYLEDIGAEVVTTPFNYILRLLAAKRNFYYMEEKQYVNLLRSKLLVEVLERVEKRFFQSANAILNETFPEFDESTFAHLKKYNMSLEHGGETAQNIVKIYSTLEHIPDISLFVHVNPIFCCAGLVSEAIFKKVEKDIGIPIVSIIYDGTNAPKNEALAPYLHFIGKGATETV